MLLSTQERISESIDKVFCLIFNKLLARYRRVIRNLSDSNGFRIHSHLVCKQTFNNFAKLANLSIWLLSQKLQITHLLRARSSLEFKTLKNVDSLWHGFVTWSYHTVKWNVLIITHNAVQSFRPVLLNGRVFVHELSGCGLESRSCKIVVSG